MSNYCKVLIVDDEALIRQGIKHYMNWEQEGFRIVGEAANGKEALALVGELRPHIVLTDLVMPVMDGEELTRQIKLRHPEIEVIVLSSFGDFDSVRATFQSGVRDYILKPKLETGHMLEVLKAAAAKIPELQAGGDAERRGPSVDAALERLLSGYGAEGARDELAAAFPHGAFCLLGADVRGRPNAKRLAAAIRERIEAELGNHAPAHRVAYRGLASEQAAALVLVNLDEQALGLLPIWARAMAGAPELAEAGSALVVGEPFAELARLESAYRDGLLRLMDAAFYLGGRKLLLHNELPEPAQAQEPFNLNRFTDLFKRERFDAAFDYVRAFMRAYRADYATDVFAFKSFLNNLMFNVAVLLGNMGYDARPLESKKYDYFKAIEEARSAEAASELLDAYVAEARACIAAKHEQAGNANMKRLLDYIHEHYAEPLNLTEMAKHFHFNPSYLSSYFSAHHNEGFVDYVHRVRLEKAEELLRAGEASISEISGLVGYSDHSYFCKVFKKHAGLSPSRYRQQALLDNGAKP
ncbi:response regulator transcription factor [Paenibacillus sp. MWE-103]|uniref:Response regulator transcription factor n=1 Tax=Paenibacillus artemisiicola TaxID=1172618 RepID=A0ABS3WEC3_9BACL|nr:response regulator transcription factor [Paenibacillus artemisiicola]MBO7746676.1 response regulator transcription factor [Paenibacillus artemisiicola]